MTLAGKVKLGALTVLALTLLVSWWGGCWRDWRLFHPKPPVIPEHVDPGQPTDPDVREVVVEVPMKAQDLSREELIAALRKHGLEVAARQAEKRARKPQEPSEPGTGSRVPGEGTEAPGASEPEFPLRLASERFCLLPKEDGTCPDSSPQIEVSSWLFEAGGSVDQTGVWSEWKPEPCPESRIFENVARWRKGIGLGIVGACVENGGEKVCDVAPAAIFGADFRSVRVGPATLELSLHGGVTQKATGALIGGLRITW